MLRAIRLIGFVSLGLVALAATASAKDAVAKGMTADQAVQTVDLKKYGREFQPNFEAANEAAIRRAYDEASGNVKN